jgi:hypothetical protein
MYILASRNGEIMKIKDLQEIIANLDPELVLVCSTEDEKFLSGNEIFKLFEIDSVSVSEAERFRDNNREPMLKFGKSEGSHPIGIINLISDF